MAKTAAGNPAGALTAFSMRNVDDNLVHVIVGRLPPMPLASGRKRGGSKGSSRTSATRAIGIERVRRRACNRGTRTATREARVRATPDPVWRVTLLDLQAAAHCGVAQGDPAAGREVSGCRDSVGAVVGSTAICCRTRSYYSPAPCDELIDEQEHQVVSVALDCAD